MNITTHILQDLISSKARELGFTACGFAKYEVLDDESARLRNWLDSGYNADMNWIEKGFNKRRDIKNILPEAKSVISLAFNYYTPFEHDDNKPKISRYAWGKDYHKILKKKLKELCEVITSPPSPLLGGEGSKESEIFDHQKNLDLKSPPAPLLGGEGGKNSEILEKSKSLDETSPPALSITPPQPSTKGREQEIPANIILKSYVDDSPVMDKVWAQRAGIGWMGKHTNIINPEYGSWFFLCEIITNIDFELYDKPIEDMCGECSLCISACPTGAIVDEYVVDSNKCISYQTIENRGEIPAELNLDGWIFGCDVCQDVCPYNSPKYNHVTGEEGFWPKLITSPPTPLLGGEGSKESQIFEHQKNLNLKSPPAPMVIPPGRDFENAPHFLEGEGGKESELSQLNLNEMNKEQLQSITEEEFISIFADSPIKRTKFTGWKRNLDRSNR